MNRAGLALLPLLVACGQEFDVHAFEAEIEVTPEVTDLGAVAVDSTTHFVLHVVHLEGEDVTLEAVEVDNVEGDYFSFDGELPVLEPEQIAELSLSYTPREVGYHFAEVTVRSDALEDAITVLVRGQAAEAAASLFPPRVDFGPAELDETVTAELFVSNEGQVDLQLVAVQLEPRPFTVASPLPLQIPAGQQVPVELAYTALDTARALGSALLELDVGGLELEPVALVANDCEAGDASLYDRDGDGYAACGGDCDDREASTHPGAEEWYDGVDQDCDGIVDEGTEGYDDDGDGYTELDGDCNDGDAEVYPGAPEDYSNGIDDDCDGAVDSNFTDLDHDGYAPEGGDCDDSDPAVNPGRAETEDGVDNDCDGDIDEGTRAYDDDGDGYTETGGDCDDTDSDSYPGAPEQADFVDNDCDGTVDEGTTHSDDDGDGYTEIGGDCDDSDPTVNPSVLETTGDGVDNDCDGVAE
jgi:hypothetical protein